MSDDGTKIIALGWSVGVYTTVDAGANWINQTGAGTRTWGDVTISADGSRPVALAYGNYIYTAYDPTLDTTPPPSDDEDDENDEATQSEIPNNGDANNDGVVDTEQDNVSSFKSAVNDKYVALEVDSQCEITKAAMKHAKDLAGRDSGFAYPNGLMDFDVNCGTPGFTATITQYYYDVSKSNLVLRKYMPTTNAFSTINGAKVEQSRIAGRTVTKATYKVTDGGVLDADGAVNGVIVDPAGLAEATVAAPNTGLSRVFTKR